jgi:hypothetical protein
MTDYRLVAANVGLELLFVFGGGLCFLIGIKKGFIEQRMVRHDKVFTGSEAVRAGIVYVLIGSSSWLTAAWFAWAWCNGRVHW